MRLVAISKADLPDLKALTSDLLAQALTPLLQGEAADIKQYAQQLVDVGLEAGAAGDQETLDSLDDTRKVLMEAARLRAAAGFDLAVKHVTDFAIRFGLQLLAGIVLPGSGPVLAAGIAAVEAAANPAPAPAPAPDAGTDVGSSGDLGGGPTSP